MATRSFRFLALVAAISCEAGSAYGAETIIRGRNEGTSAIAASNVIGSGNITIFAGVNTGYGLDGIRLDPALGGIIGMGPFLQLAGQAVPYSLQRGGPGALEAHLQATIPGNDRLRLFGIAASADLYLSTTLDTISKTTESDKPNYHPYIRPSVIVDFDLLARWKRLPLKVYVFAGMVDNPQLLFRYAQLCVRYGLEWKMLQHALFINGGTGWYQELANRLNGNRTEAGYGQAYSWIEPGGRYRFLNRFSVLGGIRIMIYQKVNNIRPLYPEIAGLSVRLEAPLLFLETNTEAIRSLVFMEQEKERQMARSKTAPAASSSGLAQRLDMGGSSLTAPGETFDYSAETQQLIKERQEIQKKLEEIERLFQGIDEKEDVSDDSTLQQ